MDGLAADKICAPGSVKTKTGRDAEWRISTAPRRDAGPAMDG